MVLFQQEAKTGAKLGISHLGSYYNINFVELIILCFYGYLLEYAIQLLFILVASSDNFLFRTSLLCCQLDKCLLEAKDL